MASRPDPAACLLAEQGKYDEARRALAKLKRLNPRSNAASCLDP